MWIYKWICFLEHSGMSILSTTTTPASNLVTSVFLLPNLSPSLTRITTETAFHIPLQTIFKNCISNRNLCIHGANSVGRSFPRSRWPSKLQNGKAEVSNKWPMESTICSGLSMLLRNANTQKQPVNLPSLTRVALLFERNLNVLTR